MYTPVKAGVSFLGHVAWEGSIHEARRKGHSAIE